MASRAKMRDVHCWNHEGAQGVEDGHDDAISGNKWIRCCTRSKLLAKCCCIKVDKMGREVKGFDLLGMVGCL